MTMQNDIDGGVKQAIASLGLLVDPKGKRSAEFLDCSFLVFGRGLFIYFLVSSSIKNDLPCPG